MSRIVLYHPELASSKHQVCCICRQPINMDTSNGSDLHQFTISHVNSTVPLVLNGKLTSSGTVPLKHGDLLSIGGAYLFMFQDYSSVCGEYIPDYNWKPLPVEAKASLSTPNSITAKSSLGVVEQNTSTSISISGKSSRTDQFSSTPGGEGHPWHHQKDVSLSSESEVSVVIEDTDSNVISMIDTRKTHGKSKSLSPPRIESLTKPPQRSETEPAVKHSNSAHQIVQGTSLKATWSLVMHCNYHLTMTTTRKKPVRSLSPVLCLLHRRNSQQRGRFTQQNSNRSVPYQKIENLSFHSHQMKKISFSILLS